MTKMPSYHVPSKPTSNLAFNECVCCPPLPKGQAKVKGIRVTRAVRLCVGVVQLWRMMCCGSKLKGEELPLSTVFPHWLVKEGAHSLWIGSSRECGPHACCRLGCGPEWMTGHGWMAVWQIWVFQRRTENMSWEKLLRAFYLIKIRKEEYIWS